MKAKILGFFCSLLIVNFAIGQTIDGRLYTQFNNWYKWRGGGFDSTLLLPQDSAKSGLRPGAVRYNIADSTVYSWSGTQWRKVGSGEIPTLQQVTTAGYATNVDSIVMFKNEKRLVELVSENLDPGGENIYGGKITARSEYISRYGELFYDGLRFKQTDSIAIIRPPFIPKRNNISIWFPDTTGYLINAVVSNGIKYDGNANGVVNLGNTDTATVVKAYVTNAEAVTITKGQVVYIFGASGDRAAVKLAKNTSDTFSSKTLGIVREDIAAGEAGWVTTQGQVSGINLGAYSPGDILWLDSVPGGFTNVKPVAPRHSVFVGVVERANAGNGLIYVKPQNGQELDELHNVKITSPTNNQVLSYTASTGIWENKTVSASIFAYTAQTTTYTAGADDYVIHCTSGTFSVNLPTAVGITGKVYIIKNSGSGLITIDPNGSQTIDGVTTYTMGGAESVQVISTGSNWITL